MLSKKENNNYLQIVLLCFLFFFLNQHNLIAAELIRIDILSVNDFHGSLIQKSNVPGGAKLSGFIKDLRTQNPNGTIVVSAGDMFQGTVRSNILQGQPVVKMMNEIKFTAMAIGNHEFDWGMDSLYKNIKIANFPMLSANIVDKQTGNTANFALPYTIANVNGVKVGIVGLTTPQSKYTTNIKVISQYDFLPPKEAVKNVYQELKAKGVQVIILLGHLDYYFINDQAQGEAVELIDELYNTQYKVDAVISGHSHKLAKIKRHNIPLVQAASNGRYVGRVTLYFSKDENKIVNSEVDVLAVPSNQSPDRQVEKIINSSAALAKPIENKIIGRTIGLEHNRYIISPLGMWINDCLRKKVEAKVSFYNSGGVRKSLKKGDITLGDMYEIIPFDNTIVTMDLTGKQIIDLLEFGLTNKLGFLQYSGLNVIYDKSKLKSSKIITINFSNGESIIKDKLYKICTNDFLADGGDGFTVFTQGKNIINTNIFVRDVLVEKIKSVGTVIFKIDNRLQTKKLADAA